MDLSPYDRIEIIVAGLEKLSARPTKFEYDPQSNPTLATEYETTCPACGSVVNFLVGDIIKRGNNNHVNCPHCQMNYFDEYEKKPVISIRMSGQEMKAADAKPVVVCPFVDPIENGTFNSHMISGFGGEVVTKDVDELRTHDTDIRQTLLANSMRAEVEEEANEVDDEIRELING